MKTTTFVLGAALATSGWLLAAPQAAGPINAAVINGDRVLEGSNVGRQARERLEAEAARWQQQINAATTELSALTKQRTDQALTLNEGALARLNQEIEEKQVQITRMNDDARRELGRLEQQITVDVNQQLGPLVDQFASQRGLDLIFDTSRAQGILYFNNARDLTDDFLAMVNAGATPERQQ